MAVELKPVGEILEMSPEELEEYHRDLSADIVIQRADLEDRQTLLDTTEWAARLVKMRWWQLIKPADGEEEEK